MIFNAFRFLGILSAIALLVVPAIVVQRYELYARSQAARTTKVELPESVGEWKRIESGSELASYVITELGLRAYDCQVYLHPPTGTRATVLLMFGHAGKLVRHPPEICYSAGGIAKRTAVEAFHFEDGERQHSLNGLAIARDDIVKERFVVVHGFHDGERWCNPRFPRIVLAGKGEIHKIQFLHPIQSAQGPNEATRKQIKQFLSDFCVVWTPGS